MATESCQATEDDPKWENDGQLAMFQKAEYRGGNVPNRTFQKGDKLLACLSPGKYLKPYSTRSHIASSPIRHDELWGEVLT